MQTTTKVAVAIAILFAAAGVGCAPREIMVVDRSTLQELEARYPSRVNVLSVERRPKGEDRVTVHVRYREGDEIPGEGVVKKTRLEELTSGGIAMQVFGTGLLVGAVAGFASCAPPTDPSSQGCKLSWATATGIAGGLIAGGVVMFVFGRVPRLVVRQSTSGIAVAPVVHQNGGGAALQIRF